MRIIADAINYITSSWYRFLRGHELLYYIICVAICIAAFAVYVSAHGDMEISLVLVLVGLVAFPILGWVMSGVLLLPFAILDITAYALRKIDSLVRYLCATSGGKHIK